MEQQQAQEQGGQEGQRRSRGPDEKFCEECGELIRIKAEICPKCGVRQKGKLSKAALLLITFFLGGIGGHKFYLGKNWQGFFYLIFCWTSIPGLIALVEFIIYACTSTERLREKYEARGNAVVLVIIIAGFVFICVAAILAAIAIPQYMHFLDRAQQAGVKAELNNLIVAEQAYYFEHGKFADSLAELNHVVSLPDVTIEIIYADENCFASRGRHAKAKSQDYIEADCNGIVEDMPDDSGLR